MGIRLSESFRPAALLAGSLALVVTVAGPVGAYFATVGSGTGTATTGTLNAATGVTADSEAGTGAVALDWTAPTDGTEPQGYYVIRTRASDNESGPACDSAPGDLLDDTDCVDSSVPDGTYEYTVVAVRGGWTARSAASDPVTVTNAVATTTTLTSSQNPVALREVVTYTATVKAGTTLVTSGTVSFRDADGGVECDGGSSRTLDGDGQATCSISYSTMGDRVVSAPFTGTPKFVESTSAPLTQSVSRAVTRTFLTVPKDDAVIKVGQAVTYTATIESEIEANGTPSGTVTFLDAGVPITCAGGHSILLAGEATCTITFASVGTRSITAAYSGDDTHDVSTSAAVTQGVGQAATSTVVTSDPASSRRGTVVRFTATVGAAAPGGGTPTGTVTFKDGATPLACTGGAQELGESGVATCDIAFESAGIRFITATYNGDANYAVSTSPAHAHSVVEPAATSTTLTTNANPAKSGATVTLTATVASVPAEAGTPTGAVTFKDGPNSIAGCDAVALDASGKATCSTTFAGMGNRSITAVYNGDLAHDASTSSSLTQKVNNGAVTGISFVGLSSGVTCTGVGTSGAACSASGGNNATASGYVAFVDASGTPMPYSVDVSSLTSSGGGKVSNPNPVTIAAGESSSSQLLATTKNGINSATVTVKYIEGATTWTATLTIN